MKPLVWIRRFDYLRRYSRRHPDRPKPTDTVYSLHIGKTGGTFLKSFIKSPDTFAEERCLIVPFGHNVLRSHLPRDAKYIFATRDPLTRFISGFGSRQRKGQPTTYKEWTRQEAWAFERFESENALAEALTDPDPARRDNAKRAMASIKHVKDKQMKWIGSLDQLRTDLRDGRVYWIRQENLQDDVVSVLDAIGCPLREDIIAGMAPVHARPGRPPVLSELGARNIRDHYAEDTELLELLAAEYKGPGRLV